MLHPNQFTVNEAWIAFQLNDQPIRTEQDGDFDFLALMDAASCFIRASVPVAATQSGPAELEAKHLLKEGQVRAECRPKTLFVCAEQAAESLVVEAERLGIDVIRIAGAQLLPFIGEAQQGFRERFDGQRGH